MGRVFKQKGKLKDGKAWVSPRWYIQYTDENGRRATRAASTDKKLSQSMLRKAEQEVEKIRLGQGIRYAGDSLTLSELAKRFLADCELHVRPSTLRSYKLALTTLILGTEDRPPAIKVRKVTDLKPTVVKDYQARAIKKLSPVSVNDYVRVLKRMLNWAVESHLIAASPLRGLRMLPHRPTKKQRALSEDEIQALLDAADDETRDVWRFFLDTGVRRNELARLTWEDVDFERKEILVRAEVAKSKRSRRIPMSKQVFQILERRAQQAGDDELVIPKIRGRAFYDYVLREFVRDLEAAGIKKEGIHIHGLRRTFATRLIRAGADPKTVQALLGHATLELTLKIYTDVAGMDLRGAVERLPEVKEILSIYDAAG